VHSLLALDFPLGIELELSLRRAVERREAFCILDQRLSSHQRVNELERLGATAVLDATGRRQLSTGTPVDESIGLVILTSGSSGPAKAAELTWDALEASATITQTTLRARGAPVWYPCIPASHIGGLAVLLRAILSEATLLWGNPDDVGTAPSRGATHVALVRTQLRRHDVSGFATVLLGGAQAPIERPQNVVTTWGMTETGSGIVYDGYALPGVEVVSVNGEICVRSPTLFRSYRTAPRPHIVGPDGRDDWFPTGDAGEVNNGKISVHGRLGFVINSGGEKIWPEDLEAALATLEQVRDVAITGVDDPEWGQRVVAFVVSDGSTFDDAIRDVAADFIGPWAKPKDIRYVAAIPRTSSGKIRRAELARLV
jgi:O-succinylbenzoic acid--CoA ligase